MPEKTSNKPTTLNGHEIQNTREVLSFQEFKEMINQYDMGGNNPRERMHSLKNSSKEKVALFLSDLNRRVNGSDDTLVSDRTMKVGDRLLIDPGERYDLFDSIVTKIQKSSDDINPERIGDALALTTTMLHPFEDGNGRTARLIGFMYRDEFDSDDGQSDFNILVTPRDKLRENNEAVLIGYVPRLGDSDPSKASVIDAYMDRVLSDSVDPNIYSGPYNQADLYRK